MAFVDEDRPRKPSSDELGADLSMLSVDELKTRIGLLIEEIKRIEAELEKKASGRSAAEKLFR
ncbi:DUF1192 domain-containing protein [Oryzifoliimicrobium ureilyticus]|uniref:DUF1192 domain-containing protein n=1 Tax=Oryzifoliimicrobium ureilyticus TaxID=3113724 RepID=UPI0030768096